MTKIRLSIERYGGGEVAIVVDNGDGARPLVVCETRADAHNLLCDLIDAARSCRAQLRIEKAIEQNLAGK